MSATVELRMSPKKRKPAGKAEQPTTGRKQYNVGFPMGTAAQIDEIAEVLGVDATNFLRMVVVASLPTYRKRADALMRGESPD